eukprot:728985-Rhodomonas_salina.1
MEQSAGVSIDLERGADAEMESASPERERETHVDAEIELVVNELLETACSNQLDYGNPAAPSELWYAAVEVTGAKHSSSDSKVLIEGHQEEEQTEQSDDTKAGSSATCTQGTE